MTLEISERPDNIKRSSEDDEVLVSVQGVSKKFCRSLKKSLWYGVQDIASELIGRKYEHELRPDEFWAVNDVSFELKRGECLGLIGHNGAGKTTLLRMLNGLIKPDKGRIEMRGRVNALIALGAGFNPILTGRENIYVNASVLGLSKKEIDEKVEEIIDFSGVKEFIDTPVQNYSSGMQVRLGFAVAASLNPDILILDEVLAVGDMQFQAKCWNKLGYLRAKGVSFILVSHQMLNIERLCSNVLYLKQGKVCVCGEKYKAIEQFENDMKLSESDHCETNQEDTVVGSGRVKIKRISFLNADNNECNSIETGQPLTVCVDYVRDCDEFYNPILELSIRDSADLIFQMSNKPLGVKLGRLEREGQIKIHIPSLPSNNERLLFSFTLWDEQMMELLDWKKRIPLQVKGYSFSTGRLHLPANWMIQDV